MTTTTATTAFEGIALYALKANLPATHSQVCFKWQEFRIALEWVVKVVER
jgi:hypothetical protein